MAGGLMLQYYYYFYECNMDTHFYPKMSQNVTFRKNHFLDRLQHVKELLHRHLVCPATACNGVNGLGKVRYAMVGFQKKHIHTDSINT